MTVSAPRVTLIVNADDFGLSAGVNAGIIRAHEQGIVTSASLMVRRPAAREAAEYARSRPALGVGLHLDFGEWEYRGGEWVKVYEGAPLDDAKAVAEEVRRQLDAFVALLGHAPTHLDSHQHVHRNGPLRAAVAGLAAELSVPARHLTPGVRYCGDYYGQDEHAATAPGAITAEALVRILGGLPPGVTEMACHPGLDGTLASAYRDERLLEVAALCDPAVKAAVARVNIELRSFAQLLT